MSVALKHIVGISNIGVTLSNTTYEADQASNVRTSYGNLIGLTLMLTFTETLTSTHHNMWNLCAALDGRKYYLSNRRDENHHRSGLGGGGSNRANTDDSK